MLINDVQSAFQKTFDIVRVIKTKRYLEAAEAMNIQVPHHRYETMVVLGLAYPKRILPSNKEKLYGSFYTFGRDYHLVLKDKIKSVMDAFAVKYELGVDNHPHNERLAAVVSGLGFFGKNQLIIHPNYGSYIFLGIVFVDIKSDIEIVEKITDNCGDCHACIDACPTGALSHNGYVKNKCISYFNQEKKALTDQEIKANYCLFGCDICQLVCPKNKDILTPNHSELSLSGKEGVVIDDLFQLSDKAFRKKYRDMAYLWKGKTVLLRNALTLLLRQKNTAYNELIQASLEKHKAKWYKETASNILMQLQSIKNITDDK